jgi:hypothetical protein
MAGFSPAIHDFGWFGTASRVMAGTRSAMTRENVRAAGAYVSAYADKPGHDGFGDLAP